MSANGPHNQAFSTCAHARPVTTRPRPLRVMYLSHGARLSGAELALVRLLYALGSDVDAQVHLAEDGPLVPALVQSGATVQVVPMNERTRGLARDRVQPGGISPRVLGDSLAYIARLVAHMRRSAPDLIHAGSLKSGLYGVSAARLAGIPAVWHVHDRIQSDYMPAAAARTMRLAINALPDAVVANSRATLATIAPRPRGGPLYRVIGYPTVLPPAPQPRTPAPLRIGMLGRITEWKGQHVVIDAFARAFPNGPERLVIVGEPMFGEREQHYARALRMQSARLGLADRLEFRGFRRDVAAELASLDILVHASVIPEPFGQVITEGMAAGLPVIAAAAGGALELVEHERTGLLHPPGDVAALAENLRRLASSSELRARLGQEARTSVGAFLPDQIARQMLGCYEDVLRVRRKQR